MTIEAGINRVTDYILACDELALIFALRHAFNMHRFMHNSVLCRPVLDD